MSNDICLGKSIDGVEQSCDERKQYFFSLLDFSKESGFAYGTTGNDILFIKLPIKLDIVQLKQDLQRLEAAVSWTLRPDVNNYFILTVTYMGDKTDQSNKGPYKEVENRLHLMPYTANVLRSFGAPVGRSRYMKLKGGDKVVAHSDRTQHLVRPRRMGNRKNKGQGMPKGGTSTEQNVKDLVFAPEGWSQDIQAGYWGRRFRVHIPVMYAFLFVSFSFVRIVVFLARIQKWCSFRMMLVSSWNQDMLICSIIRSSIL